MSELKLISWNVNGIRAIAKKGFFDYIKNENPDIICLQETKASQDQIEIDLPDYIEYWNSAERKGYSGTAIFTKIKPHSVLLDLNGDQIDLQNRDASIEGRVLILEYDEFYLANVYTPNSKRDLERLKFRHEKWDPLFLSKMKELEKIKPVIFCGDLNAAHKEIDLARPKDNTKNAGFTPEEREGIDKIIEAGFIDTFRMFNKEGGNYTWWSYFRNARDKNIGWRIDYFFVSENLRQNVKDAFIQMDVKGSDHCPVGVVISD